MKRTPKLLMFAFWIIRKHIKTENSHEISKLLVHLMTTKELIELSSTVKEAEILSKEGERRVMTYSC